MGKWLLETYAGAWWFEDNDNFFGGQLREQDPLASIQLHVSYTFKPRLWLALNTTYYEGGETTLNGDGKADRQSNSRAGITFSMPVGQEVLAQVQLEPRRHHAHRQQLHDLWCRLAVRLVDKPDHEASRHASASIPPVGRIAQVHLAQQFFHEHIPFGQLSGDPGCSARPPRSIAAAATVHLFALPAAGIGHVAAGETASAFRAGAWHSRRPASRSSRCWRGFERQALLRAHHPLRQAVTTSSTGSRIRARAIRSAGGGAAPGSPNGKRRTCARQPARRPAGQQ